MNTHTPGHWSAVPIGTTSQLFSIEANGVCIAEVWASERRSLHENGRANARLIAAAPELLEALNNVFYQAYDDDTTPDDLRATIDQMRDFAQSAIQKATQP